MQTASKKVINGWAMYDWANSVYNLVITTTFFPVMFNMITGPESEKFKGHIPFLGRTFVNTALKDYSLAFAYLIIVLLFPILSSIADLRGNKKSMMRFFCYMGAICCSLLYFFDENHVTLGIVCFALAAIGFYGSLIFYNSYLPEIAAPEDQDRVSAKGFSMGYIGSVILQLIGFGLVVMMPNSYLPLKITFLLVGVWWIGWAQIPFSRLPKGTPAVVDSNKNIFSNGFIELKKVVKQLSGMPVLKRFLFAFFFYNMGVQTIMLAATDFGSKVLKLDSTTLIITVVIIQLVAIIGAIVMSKLSARYGNLPVLLFTVILWIGVCSYGYFMHNKMEFFILATAVGLVMGGIQSLSRSTYSKLMPETRDTTSFFSFYDITEKIAIVIGLFIFGFIEEQTMGAGGMRNSVLAVLSFFVIGGVILLFTISKQKQQAGTQNLN
jgi:UMF1 family MFS transporter